MKIPSPQTGKTPFPFNLGAEVAKLEFLVPLTEFIKSEIYKSQIKQTLNSVGNEDSIKLFDDQPELIFGPDLIFFSTVY